MKSQIYVKGFENSGALQIYLPKKLKNYVDTMSAMGNHMLISVDSEKPHTILIELPNDVGGYGDENIHKTIGDYSDDSKPYHLTP